MIMNNLRDKEIVKSLVSNVAKPACLTNSDEIVFCNSHFFRMTGYNETNLPSLKNLFIDESIDFKNFASDKICQINNNNNTSIKVTLNAIKTDSDFSHYLLIFTENKFSPHCSSKERDFQVFFEENPMGIIFLSHDLKIHKINKIAREYFNLNQSVDKLKIENIVSEQSLEHFVDSIEKCRLLKKEQIIILSNYKNGHAPIICKGHIKHCSKDRVLVFFYDITREKLSENKISKEREKLESNNLKLKQALKETREMTTEVSYANNAKSEFIANISHEIRTPLNAIMGFSELLAKNITDSKHVSYLKSIIHSGRSLLDIINGILDYSKLEAGKMKVKNDEINIVSFLSSIGDIFQELSRQKGLDFHLAVDNSLPSYLELDRHLFSQIVRNLLDNAIKFTKKGSILVNVTYENVEDDYIDLHITVKDTGIGIPKNQQKKIFYAFSQKDGQAHADYGGTGLGLSIVKKTVALLSGTLEMKSKSGEGTTFKIILPHISTTNKKEIKENALIENLDIKRIDFFQKNILVLDKTKFTRLLFKNLLTGYSLTLEESSSLTEALGILKRKEINLIMINESIIIDNTHEKKLNQLINDTMKKGVCYIFYGNKFKQDIFHKWRNINFLWLDKPINKERLLKALAKLLRFKKSAEKEKKETTSEIIPKSIPKERIERLVNYLTNEISPKCQYYHENVIINKIEELCDEITLVGEKNQLLNIIEWSKKMKTALDNFDVMKIRQLLKEFDEIIKEIGLLLTNKEIN